MTFSVFDEPGTKGAYAAAPAIAQGENRLFRRNAVVGNTAVRATKLEKDEL
jgi:hypothetical protein